MKLKVFFNIMNEMKSKQQTIGLLMVVRNESKRIKKCLELYLPYVDQVAICDQQSDDGTWEILKEYAKHSKKGKVTIWQDKQWGYCEPSKQPTADMLSTDWILYVDPDEEFPIVFLEIMHKQVEDERWDAYRFPRINVFRIKVFDDNVPITPKWVEAVHPKKDHQTKLSRAEVSKFPPYLHNRVRYMRGEEKRHYDLPYPIKHVKEVTEQWEDNRRYEIVNKK